MTLKESDCSSWTFQYSARDEAGEAGGMEGGGSTAQGAAGNAGGSEVTQLAGESLIDVPGEDSPSEKGGVRAFWTDLRTGELMEATSGKAPFHDLRYTHHNEAEAQAAVDAYKNKSARGKASFRCDIGGRPGVQAEAKLILSSFRPYIPTAWRIKTATHKFESSGGYTTSIDAELFAEAQGDIPAKVKKTKPSEDDTVDPDAPPEPVEGGGSSGDDLIIDIPE